MRRPILQLLILHSLRCSTNFHLSSSSSGAIPQAAHERVDSSILPTSLSSFCSVCRCIIIDESGCQSCLDIETATKLDDNTAASHQEDEDTMDSPMPLLDSMNLPNTTTWDDASKYRYTSRDKPGRKFKGSFRGSKKYEKLSRKTPPWGSSSASALNIVVYGLARSSTIRSDGTVEWSRPILSISLKDWIEGMENDLDVIPQINGSEDHMGRDDMKDGSVESALRAIAAKLLQEPSRVWKDCNREVLKFAANALIKIARGELDEFPWFDITSDDFDFPSAEEFREANEELHRQLNGRNKYDTKHILHRLCPPMFMFAQSVSFHGHPRVPSNITHPSVAYPRMRCALYTFQAWFHGLLLDEDFVHTLPPAHRHDPHAMPRVDKAKLMLKYLHDTGVCGKLHTPIWIRIVLEGSDDIESELDVNAPEDEVQAMEAEMIKMLQEDNNMDRVREELAALVATVSFCLFAPLYCAAYEQANPPFTIYAYRKVA